MGSSYHQFCPVAKAMELLDERWTMLVIRELLLGSRHFNDIRRGVPKMSPSLLSKRLRDLTRAGIVERRDELYGLTAAGLELAPVVDKLGAWGMRWIGKVGEEDLDPKLLMWESSCRSCLGASGAHRGQLPFQRCSSQDPRLVAGDDCRGSGRLRLRPGV
jgi:DNA-binding HxlR family transcriptional regulator